MVRIPGRQDLASIISQQSSVKICLMSGWWMLFTFPNLHLLDGVGWVIDREGMEKMHGVIFNLVNLATDIQWNL